MNEALEMGRKKHNAKKINRIKTPNSKAGDVIIYFVAGVLAFVCLWPFVYTASMSVSSPNAVLGKQVWTFPVPPLSVATYMRVFNMPMFLRSYLNTIIYVILTCVLNLVICAMTAYVLATKGFRGRKVYIVLFMIPMFFSGGLIASFVTNVALGLYDSLWAIVLPASFSFMNVILIRSFFYNSVPLSIKEAAIVDGAGDIRLLFNIMVPLSKPIFAVVTLYNAVGMWNNYFQALLYLPSRDKQPLSLFVAKLLVLETGLISSLQSNAGTVDAATVMSGLTTALQLKYAVVIVAVLPIICVYPFLQKYFIKGILIGSLKE